MSEEHEETVSVRDASALRVLDAGTGRVRLPLAVMARLDVLPGDCVLLACTAPCAPWRVLGRAWPWPAQYTATDAAAADVRVVLPPAAAPLARTTLAELARQTGLRLGAQDGAAATATGDSSPEALLPPRTGTVRVVARGPFPACTALALAPATARTAAFVQEEPQAAGAAVRALLRTVVVAPRALVLVPCLAASVHPAAPAAPSLVFAVVAAGTARTAALAPGTVAVVTASTAVSFAPALAPAVAAAADTPAPPSPSSEQAVGGLSAELQTLREAVSATLAGDESGSGGSDGSSDGDDDLFARGILLKGEPGVGKTLMVREVARECDARVFAINGPEVIGSRVGESEDALRRIFASALAAAAKQHSTSDEREEQEEQEEEEQEGETKGASKKKKPVIIFIDEIDSLCPARAKDGAAGGVGGGSLVEGRVVAQVVSLFDRVRRARYRVVVVAATNRANAIDSALRRPGRFDLEIDVPVPSLAARRDILRVCTARMPLVTASADASPATTTTDEGQQQQQPQQPVDLDDIAARCVGYVGADLAALCREAALAAIRAGCRAVGHADFVAAMRRVTPSTRRNRDAVGERAPTTWDDIGGLAAVKQELREAIEWPLQHAADLARMGVRPPRGVLLHGPPGSGKTTLVRAAANACHASFFSVSGASVYSAYLGDAEAAVRRLFRRARTSTPAIVFIDEIDAIMGSRGGSGGGGSDEVRERVLSTLMNEMDGVEALRGVLVVAATNRPDLLDDALLRAGRFDRRIYIGAPDLAACEQILRIHARRIPLDATVDLAAVARRVVGCSGSDLACICREAAMASLRENVCSPSPLAHASPPPFLLFLTCLCVCACVPPAAGQHKRVDAAL